MSPVERSVVDGGSTALSRIAWALDVVCERIDTKDTAASETLEMLAAHARNCARSLDELTGEA